MPSLFAPARLPLPTSTIHFDADADDQFDASGNDLDHKLPPQHSIHRQYDYFRSLIHRQRSTSRPKSIASSTVLCVTLPEKLVIPSNKPGREEQARVAGGRSYTSLASPVDEIMATVYEVDEKSAMDDSAPSSPPDLEYSKGSKSSTSLTSDDDGSEEALSLKTSRSNEMPSEGVNNKSVGDDSNLPPSSRPTLRRPQRRSFTPGEERGTSQSPPLGQFPNGSQSRFPSLHGSVRNSLQDQSLGIPPGPGMMRSVTSPTSPYARRFPQQLGSRSPSPSHRFSSHGAPYSTAPSANATSKASTETLPLASSQRRMSWQPGRKTVEQLEAEYNDDEDDEVPDEAILENVPMSPMPGHQQNYLRSPSTHSLRSTTPSPHRRPSYANLHSANIPKNARRPSAPPTTHPHSRTPRSPVGARPPFPHAKTIAYSGENLMPKHRSKSWSDDLNLEAKRLSQALEVYAEKAAQDPAPASNRPMSLTAPKSPLRATFSKRNKSVAEIPTFPPIQTSVVTLDPIPISKEKEAVLTRTRPSWLPPKSKKEEKRHLKEFQQMMARAAEAEKKRAAKDQEAQETREEMQDSIARIWEQHVLPNWDAVVREPRTRELWWRGVTTHNRGQVWSRAIGNELELTAASYSAALSRAHTLESSISTLPVEDRAHHKEAAWFDAITRDVPNVLPEERVFQMGGRLHAQLRDVLKAYAMYRSDVGYVYGTHLIAGLLVLYLPNDPAAAFVVLANMLNRPLPLAFLVHDPVAMARTHELVLSTLRYKFPSLHDHLTSSALGLQPDEYLDPLFRCLFAYNLPSSHVARIWDLYAFEGDRALIRAAVAVLGCLESKLYGSKEEVLNVISWRCEAAWDLGDEEVFVKAVREAGKVDGKGGEN